VTRRAPWPGAATCPGTGDPALVVRLQRREGMWLLFQRIVAGIGRALRRWAAGGHRAPPGAERRRAPPARR
jgi:hypothetical protein